MAGYIQANDLERVASMLADNYGIKVVCKGTKCATNGRTITLPSLPPDRTNPKVLSLIRYFLDHEVGHIVGKSDLSLKAGLEEKYGKGAGEILNVLEDVRVERLMSAAYAGCGINLNEGGTLVREKQEALMLSNDPDDEGKKKQLEHPVKQLLSSIYLIGRGDEPLSFVKPEVLELLKPFASEVATIATWAKKTADLMPLAEKIIDAYKQAAQGGMDDEDDSHAMTRSSGQGGSDASGSGGKGGGNRKRPLPPPPADQQDEEDSNEDTEGEEEAEDDAEDQDKDEEEDAGIGDDLADDDEADAGDDAGGDGDGTDAGTEAEPAGGGGDEPADGEPVLVGQPQTGSGGSGGGGGGRGGGTGGTDTQAMFEAALDYEDVAKAISTLTAETIGEVAIAEPLSMIRPVRRDIDRIQEVPMQEPPQSFIDECKAAGGSMRQKLAQLLMSEASIAHIGGLRRGKPDSRALSRLVSGSSKHVFRRRVEVPAPDTACSLIIDCSGSMEGQAVKSACMAAAAFAHVLDQCHHASMICGFDDDYKNQAKFSTDETEGPGVRVQGITLWRCKNWNEPFRETLGRIWALMKTGGGGTPIAEAMHMAAAELNNRVEKRKVMIVFTDGAPGWYGGTVDETNVPQEVDEKGELQWGERNVAVWEYEADGKTVKKDQHGRDIYKRDKKGDVAWATEKFAVKNVASAYVRKIAMECERSGIEVIMVGIGTDAVKTLHTKYAVVNSLTDLATTTMVQLTNALHAGRHR